MKAYYYTPEDLELEQFPAGGRLRLAGIERTDDPATADVFVLPPMMNYIGLDAIHNLPYLKGNERRHVFENISDWMGKYFNFPGIFFRCDCTRDILENNPTTIAWPWPVDDLEEWVPFSEFKYDVCFQGWVSKDLTNVVCDSVENTNLDTHIQKHDFFYGYLDESTERAQRLRESFLRTLSQSRLSLVPRSIPQGVVRYRFYEAMSMGRVPVHFCDKCILPFGKKFGNRIDYDRCSIHIPEKDAHQTGEILKEWLAKHSDEEIIEMGRYGRQSWENWLNRDLWGALFSYCVKERLAGRL